MRLKNTDMSNLQLEQQTVILYFRVSNDVFIVWFLFVKLAVGKTADTAKADAGVGWGGGCIIFLPPLGSLVTLKNQIKYHWLKVSTDI